MTKAPPFCAVLLLGCLGVAVAQRQTPYLSDHSEAQRSSMSAETPAIVEKYFRVPPDFDKDKNKAYLSECAEIAQHIQGLVQEEAILDDALLPYLQRVHQHVCAKNPDLPPSRVVLTANPTPNAYSIGEGTLVFFTGLLSELENEDQLAFVVCHELAHFVLGHAPDGLARHVEYLHSAALKAELEKIKSAEYNQSDLLHTLLRNVEFKTKYHGRGQERQADSLALLYLLNTNYAPRQAERLLLRFEAIDEPLTDSLLHLRRDMGCAHHPYKPTWGDKEPGSEWAEAVAAQQAVQASLFDSLSTHPDSRERQRWVKNRCDKLAVPEKNATVPQVETRLLAAIENTAAWYDIGRFDRAIFTALLYRQRWPDCAYFSQVIALSLSDLLAKTKAHQAHESLEQPSPYYEFRYNELLSLLNRLRLRDLLELQRCFLDVSDTATGDYALYAQYRYATDSGDKDKAATLRKQYLKDHPKGRFAKNLK
jgi:Zn-dependent protease with chaperone function